MTSNTARSVLKWLTVFLLPLGAIVTFAGAQLSRDSFSGTSPALPIGIVIIALGLITGLVLIIVSATAPRQTED
jgi:hypothetical protein